MWTKRGKKGICPTTKHSPKITFGRLFNKMPWPSQIPDINPIENLFGWVKQKLVKEGPKTIAELKWKLEEIWGNIEPEFFIPYWKSMVTRCNMVIEGSGECIND